MKTIPRLFVALFLAFVPLISSGSAAPQAATIEVNTTADDFAVGGDLFFTRSDLQLQ